MIAAEKWVTSDGKRGNDVLEGRQRAAPSGQQGAAASSASSVVPDTGRPTGGEGLAPPPNPLASLITR